MTRPTVGFYVHHDGAGHASRTAAIARCLPGPVTAASTLDLSSVPGFEAVDTARLPDDRPDDDPGDVTANGAFHWTPERPDVNVPRLQALLGWIDRTGPDVVVVDASVEAATVARLAGVPVVVVRQHGDRRDAPHQLAYRLADVLLAPFAAALEDPDTPSDVLDKTVHCGVIGRPATAHAVGAAEPHLRPRVVVVWGRGTEPLPGPLLDEAALATPDWDWEVVGPRCPVRPPTMVHHRGWVDDVDAVVAHADVLVGPPSNGTVALVARTGLPFVALPDDRPFGEQQAHAARLEEVGVALVRLGWPGAEDWPTLLRTARSMSPDRVRVLEHEGASRRAAEVILSVVEDRRVSVLA